MLIWIEIRRVSTVRAMIAPSSSTVSVGRHGWGGSLMAVVACAALSTGCVQRRMTIRSNPPGALVYVDDYQLGATPVSHDFVYYGTRKIRLVKDGYETLTVRQPFPLPWYQYFPLDFVTENLLPWEIRDERVVDLAMQPAGVTPPESVVARAEQARLSAGSLPPAPAPQVVTPLPQPVAPQPIPAPPPAMPPLQQFAPVPPPGPPQGLVLPPPSPSPFQGLQPPLQNAPSQGIPSLGVP
jgi:hypothetical protein